jgi:hypothetical protein
VDHTHAAEQAFLWLHLQREMQLDLGEAGQVALQKGRSLVGLIRCAPENLPTFLTLRSLSSKHIYDTEPFLTRHQN